MPSCCCLPDDAHLYPLPATCGSCRKEDVIVCSAALFDGTSGAVPFVSRAVADALYVTAAGRGYNSAKRSKIGSTHDGPAHMQRLISLMPPACDLGAFPTFKKSVWMLHCRSIPSLVGTFEYPAVRCIDALIPVLWQGNTEQRDYRSFAIVRSCIPIGCETRARQAQYPWIKEEREGMGLKSGKILVDQQASTRCPTSLGVLHRGC